MSTIRDLINQALAQGHDLEITYRDYNRNTSQRQITPVEWKTPDLLTAQCHLRNEERNFRINNIQTCSLVPRSAATNTPPVSISTLAVPLPASAPPASETVPPSPTLIPARKAIPPRQHAASNPVRINRVKTAEDWNRLLRYYRECLIGEVRQQNILQDLDHTVFFFDSSPEELYRFLGEPSQFAFPARAGNSPTHLTRWVRQIRTSGDRQLCVGYPLLVLDENRLAPLLITHVEVQENEDTLALTSLGYEISYAALRSMDLNEEEIDLVLRDCSTYAASDPNPGLSQVESFLIQRLEGLLGRSLLRSPKPKRGPLPVGILLTQPCLFSVKAGIATTNLLDELKTLADPVQWTRVPDALRTLLSGIPEHDYASTSVRSAESRICVTAANPQQRRIMTAVETEPVTVVTGPPGTGKSQLILNLIAQACLRGERVLFASRNNKAVDVVMTRLQEEVKFPGAVRTGNQGNRSLAITHIASALDHLAPRPTVEGTAYWRAAYTTLEKELGEGEARLAQVREWNRLAQTYQNERADLLKLLAGSLRVPADKFAPRYHKQEFETLLNELANLRETAIRLQDRERAFLEEVTQWVQANPNSLPLVAALHRFQTQWGSFGGGFLNKVPHGPDALVIYLQTWQDLLSAVDSRISLDAKKDARLDLQRTLARRQGALADSTHVQEWARRFTREELAGLISEAQHLKQRAVIASSRGRLLWAKLLTWLGRSHPASPFIADLQDLEARLGMDPGRPEGPNLERPAQWAPLTDTLVITLETGQVQQVLDAANQGVQVAEGALEAALVKLPEAVREDFPNTDMPAGSTGVPRTDLGRFQTTAAELLQDRSQLAERMNRSIQKNACSLQVLTAARAGSLGPLPELWTVSEADSSNFLRRRLDVWRDLVSLWITTSLLEHVQKQLGGELEESKLLDLVRDRRDKLDHAGAGLVSAAWREHGQALDTAIIQSAHAYASAVRQLLERRNADYDPRVYAGLKQAEKENFPAILQVFPVWATTNLAAKSNLPLETGLFDLVIIDEASQCDIPSALPLLYRARRVVIVGDRMQLRHVATLYPRSEKQAANEMGVASEWFSYTDFSLFDIAKRSAGNHPGELLLNEHYRCHSEIIEFSNQEFYDRALVIQTDLARHGIPPQLAERGGGVFWINVPGQAHHPSGGSARNQPELEAIQKLVPQLRRNLAQHGLSRLGIGIVTPYREQEQALRKWLAETPDGTKPLSDQILAGTAHKFQGDERDLMIFSPVLAPGLSEGSLHWLETTTNLLNVAITRARATLLIVGDWEYCRSLAPSNPYRHLADYVSQERVLDNVSKLDLLGGPPFNPVGALLSRNNKAQNRATLKRLVLSCEEFLWWLDSYMSDHVFDLLLDACQDPNFCTHDIRILTMKEQVNPNEGMPQITRARMEAARSELQQRGMKLEVRMLPKNRLPHDRYLYSHDYTLNMPPFGGAYGDHNMISEYTQSNTDPDFFIKYWDQAETVQPNDLQLKGEQRNHGNQ